MNISNFALLFPGQGSQKVGMGFELAEYSPSIREIYQEADEILNFPISNISWHGPENELNDTINTQPSLLVHSVASLFFFRQSFPDNEPMFVAGHSMGELSTLFACDAASFLDTLRLTRQRGYLMKRAGQQSPGGMAAIIALDTDRIDQICMEASNENDIVQIANDNCPGQVVISGSSAALERAMQMASDFGARKVTKLAVSIAAHSPLMSTAQNDFNLAVQSTEINHPRYPIIGNVSALPLSTSNEIKNDLQSQLTSRVRWTESIQYMINNGVSLFLELGSGSVLTSLIKRIDRNVTALALGTPEDFDKLSMGEV
jgi:[acyl-carrier-protein] S-malonyltransferase